MHRRTFLMFESGRVGRMNDIGSNESVRKRKLWNAQSDSYFTHYHLKASYIYSH